MNRQKSTLSIVLSPSRMVSDQASFPPTHGNDCSTIYIPGGCKIQFTRQEVENQVWWELSLFIRQAAR
ncbi:unnamed protein product [Musa banksii]